MKVTDKWVQKFVREVLPQIVRQYCPRQVVLFGSRARGTAKEESDLDIIVISDRFEGTPFLKRMPALLRLVPLAKHIDYLCYTPEEFERLRGSSATVRAALEEGVVLVEDGEPVVALD
ncbi:MAG TPA: nucleotidyltransferase domain-containing protein [Planctomycetaceae bacterium]|nr:nucleotidyltransferase domain-containing protein [Planctomycetaceae bacterium]